MDDLNVLAGMPSISLTDSAVDRINAISFFLLVILLSTGLIRFCWKQLRDVFPAMPVLTWKQSAGLSLLFGFCSIIVLTMISGARELMTPGAWQKNGLTYRLTSAAETEQAAKPPDMIAAPSNEREEKIKALRDQLLLHSLRHEGKYPDKIEESEFEANLWQLPTSLGGEYILLPGRKYEQLPLPVVLEPEIEGTQWVIFANGDVREMKPEVVRELVE